MSKRTVSFYIDQESYEKLQQIPRRKKSFVIQSLLKNLPEELHLPNEAKPRIPALIKLEEDKIIFFNDRTVHLPVNQILGVIKKKSFETAVDEICALLAKKDVPFNRANLIDVLITLCSNIIIG